MATTQNTPVLIGASIETAHVNAMVEVHKAIGLSPSSMMNRAIGFWLEVEAPVYLEYHGKRKPDQPTDSPEVCEG